VGGAEELARVKIDRVGDGVYQMEVEGHRETVYVSATGGDQWAFWDGHVFHRTAAPPGSHAERTGRGQQSGPGSGPHEVTAPMPGTILKVLVGPGAAVRHGETLILLEAMKMEIALPAPRDGTVKSISCKPGDLVQPDVTLVELE
jgi:biotin carboxyl carrier protein